MLWSLVLAAGAEATAEGTKAELNLLVTEGKSAEGKVVYTNVSTFAVSTKDCKLTAA